MRNQRSLEGKLVMALVLGLAIGVAGIAAASIYSAFTDAAARIEAVTSRSAN